MPALVNSSVGSLPGTSELDGTTVWPFLRKNSRKLARISALVIESLVRIAFHAIPVVFAVRLTVDVQA